MLDKSKRNLFIKNIKSTESSDSTSVESNINVGSNSQQHKISLHIQKLAKVANSPNYTVPFTIQEVARFALIGRDKLQSVKAEISAIKKLNFAKEVYEQKLQEAQAISEMITLSEVQIGVLLKQIPKATPQNNPSGKSKSDTQNEPDSDLGDNNKENNINQIKPKSEVIKELGFSQKQSENLQKMAEYPDIINEVIENSRKTNTIITRASILKKIKQFQKAEEEEEEDFPNRPSPSPISSEPEFNIMTHINNIPNKKYDLFITSPPKQNNNPDWLYDALEHLSECGKAYIFINNSPDTLKKYLNATIPNDIELNQIIILKNKNVNDNSSDVFYKQDFKYCLLYLRRAIIPFITPKTININNSFQDIVKNFIKFSTSEDSIVFDPFPDNSDFLSIANKLSLQTFGLKNCETETNN